MSIFTDHIRSELFILQDLKYRDFSSSLNPAVNKDTVIGVRTPELKKLTKELFAQPETSEFLNDLPHKYFEENNLHAFIIAGIKNYDELITELDRFLPYVDNWATCDQLRPAIFKKNRDKLISDIKRWLKAEHIYTVRFAIGMLMCHYLDDEFTEEYPKIVAGVKSNEYYLKMMVAWYFATALAKQYDSAISFIENKMMDKWTHNKAIQKAIESFRVSEEHKTYLKTLKY